MQRRFFILVLILIFLSKITPVFASDAKLLHEAAVAKARSGLYSVALSELHQLAGEGFIPASWDEMVVLGWAGRYTEAVAAFEKLVPGAPEYVRLSAASSYFRLSEFAKAALIYHDAAESGNKAAALLEAESLLRLGEKTTAIAIYNRLLQAAPQDVSVYQNRGTTLLSIGDVAGFTDLQKALALSQSKDQQLDMRNQLAGEYIRREQFSAAIAALQPAIDDKSATPRMQSDYIFALRLDGDAQRAIKEGVRLWSEPANIPAYGIQALADAYLRNSQPKEALVLYNGLLSRKSGEINRKDVLSGRAYALFLDGQVSAGKSAYSQLLTEFPTLADTAASDAAALMELGRFWPGKELFKLVIGKFPQQRSYRQQYALLLSRKNMPREASAEYEALAKLPDSQPIAGAGLAVTALSADDYSAARKGIEQLKDASNKNPLVAQAKENFAERPLTTLALNSISQQDYKGKQNSDLSLSGEKRLSDNLSSSSSFTVARRNDAAAKTISNYATQASGLVYRDLNHEASLAWNRYNGDISGNGYQFRYSRFFGDQSNISLEASRSPFDDASAIRAGIFQTNQRLSFNRSLGVKDSYTVALNQSALSDGNSVFGYDGIWNHIYYDKNALVSSWYFSFNRSSYKYQTVNNLPTIYESPALRENYELGLRRHWSKPWGYIEHLAALNWNRDKGETFSFAPYNRLEYGYRFAKDQWLVLGFEYGLRTSQSTSGLQFSYRKYELNYHQTW